jgi:hypothetical protein
MATDRAGLTCSVKIIVFEHQNCCVVAIALPPHGMPYHTNVNGQVMQVLQGLGRCCRLAVQLKFQGEQIEKGARDGFRNNSG